LSSAAVPYTAQPLKAYVDAIGLLGPGLSSWEQARPVLIGKIPAQREKAQIPPPESLPPAERRRAGLSVKAALVAGQQALKSATVDIRELATVFTSSGGDGINCHEICAALTQPDRMISPTRFHNSVHNAPSGYWSISSGAMAPSSVLCAYDGSFGAGLLEAMTQVATENRPVLLLAYDTDYPQPLHGVRPVPDTLGVALLLSPHGRSQSIGQLSLQPEAAFTGEAAETLVDPVLEWLRTSIPAARCLPLLRTLALAEHKTVVIDYLDNLQMAVQVAAC
jgi:hypothetical protein